MVDYVALKAEIEKPAYAGMDDAAIAVALVASSIQVYRDVPVGEIGGYLLVHGVTFRLKEWLAATPTTEQTAPLKGAVYSLMELIADPHISVVRMSDPATRVAITAMLDGMRQATLVTDQQHDDLLAMADGGMQSVAEVIGCGDLMVMDDASRVATIAHAGAA